MSNRVIIGLGSNLGNKKENILSACKSIGQLGEITQISSLYETAAWGYDSENVFYNACIEIETDVDPATLLAGLVHIENKQGRQRLPGSYLDRKIDLDILLFGDLVIDTPELVIPHPHIAIRKFALIPLDELVPNFVHPKLKKTINELLNLCLDSSQIKRID